MAGDNQGKPCGDEQDYAEMKIEHGIGKAGSKNGIGNRDQLLLESINGY